MELTNIITTFVCILLALTLHEASHAYASYLLGDDTARMRGRLTLNPLAHIDPVMTLLLPLILIVIGLPPFGAARPVPYNPLRLKYSEIGVALVAAAGPAMNLFLAAFTGLVIQFFLLDSGSIIFYVLYTFMAVNVSFFLFNLIPFPPLDGSRIIYAVAPDPVRDAFEWVESMGMMSTLLFFISFSMLLGPFSDAFYAVINFLLGGSAIS